MKGSTCVKIFVVCLVCVLQVNAQFEDLKACLTPSDTEKYVEELLGCFVAKFVVMAENSSLTQPRYTSSSGQRPNYFSHSDFMDSKMQRVAPFINAGGPDQFLQKLYFQRFETINLQGDSSSTQNLPTLADLLDDLLAVHDKKQHGEEGEAGGIGQKLVSVHQTKLDRHFRQFVGGRIVPALRETMEGRVEALSELSTLASNDNATEMRRIVDCLQGIDEAEYEDGLTWLRCLFTCDDLPLISTCIVNVTNMKEPCTRVPWISDLFIRLFTDFIGLQTCFFKILNPESGNLTLIEGGETEYLEFINYLPPGVQCFPPNLIQNGIAKEILIRVFNLAPVCKSQIQMTTTNYVYDILPYVPSLGVGRPRCRNHSAINQVAIGWHENAVNVSGIIVLNTTNWNSTFRIPLTAVVDHKIERGLDVNNGTADAISVNFTLKFVVDGERFNTTKVPLLVVDRDSRTNASTTCQSINDPHIISFDGFYYNNFYHGYFQLYKHTTLPYEVQVVYQACNDTTQQSCNCGVAVRSGDDVFVVDRCRLKSDYCSSPDNCRIMKATMYTNGELTPGTRILQLDGGLGYQVILPHGTIVKVKANGQQLNVWLTPSVYDIDNTLGLCGTFNDDVTDDLMFPNGTVYKITGTTDTDQPRPFILAWRLPYSETIFEGTTPSGEPFLTSNYCRCNHIVYVGIRCHCGYDKLVETCDLDLGEEYLLGNLSSFYKHSQLVSNGGMSTDQRDVNESYIPPVTPSKPGGGWNITAAKLYCRNALNSNAMVAAFTLPDVYNTLCVDDIKITADDNIDWRLSAIEAAKLWCRDNINSKTHYPQGFVQRFENNTCISECYNNGQCMRGVCDCNAGYTGPDCSVPSVLKPVVIASQQLLCDVRHQNCSFMTFYGQRFMDDNSFTCSIQQVKVLETETSINTQVREVKVLYLSVNQMACMAETSSSSYSVSVKSSGTSLASFTFMAYDSACYKCDTSSETCSLKRDGSYCYIASVCYANLQHATYDSCLYCNVTYSVDKLYDSMDAYCVAKREEEARLAAEEQDTTTIRIIVSVTLSCVIIIFTIVMFIVSYRKDKAEAKKMATGDDTSSHSSVVVGGKVKSEIEMTEVTGGNQQQQYANKPVLEANNCYDNVAFTTTPSDPNAGEVNHVTSSVAGNGGVPGTVAVVVVSENGLKTTKPRVNTVSSTTSHKKDESLNPAVSRRVSQLIGDDAPRSRSSTSTGHTSRPRLNSASSVTGIGGAGPIPFGRRDSVLHPDHHSSGIVSDLIGFGVASSGGSLTPTANQTVVVKF